LSLLRQAQERHPDDFWANHNLAEYLHQSRPPRLEEAIRYSTAAVALRPQSPGARLTLGVVLHEKGDQDGAITQFREAINLNPDSATAHNDLGSTLVAKGLLDEAVAEFREALRLMKDYPHAHHNLGIALKAKGLLDEAIAQYREAIHLDPDCYEAHDSLGIALLEDKGLPDEAVTEFREALRVKKDFAGAHYNLGNALGDKGLLDEAIAEYQEALRLEPDHPTAHCNLGRALVMRGQFKDAVKAVRRGHELGSRNPRWPYPSAQWLRRAERMAELDDCLSAVLEGKAQPKDAAERVIFAQLCQQFRKRYAAAERFYEESFAAQPALAENLSTGHRYNAACGAALAGCGQGQDAGGLDKKERARLRRQALDWLHADLMAWRRLLEKEPAKARPAVVEQMHHWLGDADFACVRGEAALAKLPEAERPGWQKLWEEVEALNRRAARSPPAKRSASP
jgi:tetratricopeptide (TPR) repeat protein